MRSQCSWRAWGGAVRGRTRSRSCGLRVARHTSHVTWNDSICAAVLAIPAHAPIGCSNSNEATHVYTQKCVQGSVYTQVYKQKSLHRSVYTDTHVSPDITMVNALSNHLLQPSPNLKTSTLKLFFGCKFRGCSTLHS